MMRLIIFIMMINTLFSLFSTRSIHRPCDPYLPEIITYWPGSSTRYYLRDSHLEECAVFHKFDRDYFLSHLLPEGPISFRKEPDKTVSGEELSRLLEEAIAELRRDRVFKSSLQDFEILKARDFNWKNWSGLLVLKFKKYPFVAKLFIQTPETFVKPFSHGYESACLFVMGGGITRYLAGFTRIKNLEEIKKIIEADPYWCNLIDFPRKWFWQPKNNRWYVVEGHNIGVAGDQFAEFPSVYGIICDAIDNDGPWWLFNKKNRKMALRCSQTVGNRLDPHIDNFMVEKSSGKIVLVDTEHFPTMVGLNEPMRVKSYSSWYFHLMCKYLKDRYGRSKRKRREIHRRPAPAIQYC